MEHSTKEKTWMASCNDYDFVSKLSNRQIKDAIKALKHSACGADENTRLASLHILTVELAARHSRATRFNGKDVYKDACEHEGV